MVIEGVRACIDRVVVVIIPELEVSWPGAVTVKCRNAFLQDPDTVPGLFKIEVVYAVLTVGHIAPQFSESLAYIIVAQIVALIFELGDTGAVVI